MIANGIARESLYGSSLGEFRAHQVSTLTAVILLAVYTFFVFPWLRVTSAQEAWRVGGLWVVLTVAFEFGFGRFIAGHSWSRLLEDYYLFAGRVWVLFLLAVALAPWVAFLFRGRLIGGSS